MKSSYEHEVKLRTEKRAYLIPIFTHVHDIPRRVYEYDASFFVVFKKTIKSMRFIPWTIQAMIPIAARFPMMNWMDAH
jgi:hypothetical protein